MKYFLWLLCFLLACDLVAQPKNNLVIRPKPLIDVKYSWVDSASLRISYALNAVQLDDISTYVDLQCLEIGKRISKYYSTLLNCSDSLVDVWVKEHPGAVSIPNWLGEGGQNSDCWSEYQYSEIFRSGGELTMYCRMPQFFSKYDCWYAEAYPQQQWELLQDTLTICGHLCQKAVCSFRGRSFEAWFAPGIPIGEGPWAFGGLSGLILKVYDTDRLYTFECVRIEQGCFPIKKYDYSRFKPVERSKILRWQRKLNEDYFKQADLRDEKTREVLSFFKPYEPLELE